MLKSLICLILATMLYALTAPTPSAAQPQPAQTEKAPYIQYYSSALQGIVVERADGTDSRVLGRGLIPNNHNWIDGPGWSPSGKWFAWYSFKQWDHGRTLGIGVLTRSDGSKIFDLPQDLGNVFQMEWSPDADILLIGAYTDYSEVGNPSETTFYVIDASLETLLFSITNNGSAKWAANGKHILIYGYANDGLEIKLFALNGAYVDYSTPYRDMPFWSPDGRLILSDSVSKQITFIDPNSNALTSYPAPDGRLNDLWVHPDTTSLFGIFEQNKQYSLWEFDLASEQWYWLEDNRLGSFIQPAKEISPDYQSIVMISTLGRLTVWDMITKITTEIEATGVNRYLWSNTGRYLLYWKSITGSSYYAHEMWLYDTQTQTSQQLATRTGHLGNNGFTTNDEYLVYPGDASFILMAMATEQITPLAIPVDTDPMLLWDNSTLTVDLDSLQHIITITLESYRFRGQVYQYDLLDQIFTQIDRANYRFRYSPNREHLAYYGRCAMPTVPTFTLSQLCLEDVATQQNSAFPFGGNADDLEIKWHSDSDWLIAIELREISEDYYSIVRHDGQYYRPINNGCFYFNNLCMDWIPTHIDVDTLMAPPQDDLQTNPDSFQAPTWVSSVAWSPDGQYIAAGYNYRLDHNDIPYNHPNNGIVIFDVQIHEIVGTYLVPYRYVIDMQIRDGLLAALVTPEEYWHNGLSRLEVWIWELGKTIPIEQITNENHPLVYDVPFSDTEWEFSLNRQRLFILPDAMTWQYAQSNATFIGDSRYTLDENFVLHRFDLQTNVDQEFQLEPASTKCIYCPVPLLTIHQQWIAVPLIDHRIVIWNRASQNIQTAVLGYASDLEFSPDGTRLAVGTSYLVQIYDLES